MASSSASTEGRSTSRVWARVPAGSGSSVTNSTASMARRSASRSSTGSSSFILHSRVGHGRVEGSLVQRHLDLTERLGLTQVDLPFTVQLEQSQEPDHHVDAVLAVRDEVTGQGGPDLTE